MKYHCLNCNYGTNSSIGAMIHSFYRLHTLFRDYSHDNDNIKEVDKI